MLRLLIAVLAIGCTDVQAGWVVDSKAGCKVQVQYPQTGEVAEWSGPCVDGFAEGAGTLTSSNGTFLKGAFRKGRPVQAKGRELVVFNYGGRSIVGSDHSNGMGYQYNLDHTQSDPRANPTSSTPMVGRWSFNPAGVTCPEVHQYFASGRRVLSNGDERIESAFTVFEIAREPTLFKVLHTKLAQSGKSACATDTDPVGRSYYLYIRFEGKDTFQTCSSFDESSCFGVATRIAE